MTNDELNKLIEDLRAIPVGVSETELTPLEQAVLILAKHVEKEIGNPPWEYQVGDTVIIPATKEYALIEAVKRNWITRKWDIIVINKKGRVLRTNEWNTVTSHESGKRKVNKPIYNIGDVVDFWQIYASYDYADTPWGKHGELRKNRIIAGYEVVQWRPNTFCYYTETGERGYAHHIRPAEQEITE